MQRWLLLVGLSLAACRSERASSVGGSERGAAIEASGAAPTSSAAPASGAAPTSGAAPASSPSNPFEAHALAPEERRWFEGSVEETLAAGSYVYLRVRTAEAAPVWVASLAATTPSPPLGHVRVLVLGRAEHFHSRRLARDFSPLSFGVIRTGSSDPDLRSKGIEP